MTRSGFLVVDKPPGVTSFSLVAVVRRLTGVRRVGHAGTLDPMATGVLPVAIGSATRLIEYLDDAPKRYLAQVQLGTATDTYDADGEVVARVPAGGLSREAVEAALTRFVGEVEQRPPPYSAIKLAGKPLYRYAREGDPREAPPRIVRIDAVTLIAYTPPMAEIDVVCGKGTYIRSLAHDLGEALGCGAHLSALRRAESGGFTLRDSHTIEAISRAAAEGTLDELLLAPDRAVERRPAVILGAALGADLALGRDLDLGVGTRPDICRAYSTEGEFLGVLRPLPDDTWHPQKVLPTG